MINWHILSASANNGGMRVCVRHRMKKGIYIVIMKIIRINGAPRVVACRLAWVCARTVVPLNGMVCTDTPGSRSRMTCACMRVRLCACLCGIVGTYLCCHGLRCGSSSRRRGHGRPDSQPPSFSVSPCRRLRTGHEKLEGIVRTFGNLPAWNERLEARGAHGMHALWAVSYTHLTLPTKRIV